MVHIMHRSDFWIPRFLRCLKSDILDSWTTQRKVYSITLKSSVVPVPDENEKANLLEQVQVSLYFLPLCSDYT